MINTTAAYYEIVALTDDSTVDTSAVEGAGAGASDAFKTELTSVVDVRKGKSAKTNDRPHSIGFR